MSYLSNAPLNEGFYILRFSYIDQSAVHIIPLSVEYVSCLTMSQAIMAQWITCNIAEVKEAILPFYKTRASVRLRLPVAQKSTKSLKKLWVLHAKTFEMTIISIMNASDCFKVNSSVMNVNCYYIVYFSIKSFYPHFR